MDSTGSIHEADPNEDKMAKRPKLTTQRLTTIEDLNARKSANTFQGNVLVVYKVVLDRSTGTREVLRADLTDSKGEMTITLSIGSNLIQKYENTIVAGTAIAITDFDIGPKSEYDRGDSDCILTLNDSSIVETIPLLSTEYKFIPSTTIKNLLTSTEDYPNGSVGAIVAAAYKKGSQYILDIKDGHTNMDQAPLYMHSKFAHFYLQMQEKLHKSEMPILLFRSIAKKLDQKHSLRTTLATYICPLNDKRTTQQLNDLLHTTFEVLGVLKPTNAFCNPFHAYCPNCNFRFEKYGVLDDNQAYCTRCKEQVTYYQD